VVGAGGRSQWHHRVWVASAGSNAKCADVNGRLSGDLAELGLHWFSGKVDSACGNDGGGGRQRLRKRSRLSHGGMSPAAGSPQDGDPTPDRQLEVRLRRQALLWVQLSRGAGVGRSSLCHGQALSRWRLCARPVSGPRFCFPSTVRLSVRLSSHCRSADARRPGFAVTMALLCRGFVTVGEPAVGDPAGGRGGTRAGGQGRSRQPPGVGRRQAQLGSRGRGGRRRRSGAPSVRSPT
jgi:hypothetical protein